MTSPLRPAVLWPLALAVGVGVFFVTCLTEPAETHTLNFGTEYGEMAKAPFALLGKFPHRLLAPLVAHVLGLAGERYWMFAHGCTMLLIAMIFATAERHGARPWQALLLTTVIGFTGTIQIYKGHVGYPDPITWALMLATILAVRRPVLFWSLQFLNVMHHEQILFFWPWLLYWRHRDDWRTAKSWLPDVLGGAVAAGAYYLWCAYVHHHAPTQLLTTEHYEKVNYFPIGTIGLTALNLLSTYIWFGALPVIIAWHVFFDGWRRVGFGVALYLVSLHAVFGVAHDVYRFTCFLFVPLLFAGLRLMTQRAGWVTLLGIGLLSAVAIKRQAPVFEEIGTAVLVEQTANGPAVRPEPVMTIVPEVIPMFPWTFAAYGLALIATIAVGWAWARRSRVPITRADDRPDPTPE
ncbi:MAG TPA: hypothetical protein VFZ65_10025 [Planctomycetota bacterium]|nr:hypothetical protein [Planctomycetota bacterium]